MSQAPSSSSSGSSSTPYGEARDPVVAIIEDAGHEADPQVVVCARLAAAAHVQRAEDGRADGRAVNRSTFLWALARVDSLVRTALEQNGVRLEAWQGLLFIRDDPPPLAEPYALAEDLERALRTFVDNPRKLRLTITPWSLAVAVLEDIVANGGLVGDRLRRLGASPEAVLATLRALLTEDSGGEVEVEIDDALLPRMRDITPLRFGVKLPSGMEDPGPYVRRDVDGELGRQLRERMYVVAVEAQAGSGATRMVYEALRKERPDDRVLILHEWLDARADANTVDGLDLYGLLPVAAQVVWVRNLGELVERYPVVKDWFLERGVLVAATLVVIVRPEDRQLAGDVGLAPDTWLELTAELSADEQSRAQALYDGELTVVAALAGATVRRNGVRRANYAADSAAAGLLNRGTDDLGVRADVDMLARLIASKDVHPPLSIGLFGPWGSGKTFLMNQVQLRIEDLGDRSRALPANAQTTGYLTEVIPVKFNAWQYAHGTALWAALITRVFEEIRTKLAGDERYQKILLDLKGKDLGVAQARQRLAEAQAKVEHTLPAAHDRVITDVAQGHDMTEKSTDQIEKVLDLDVATQQVSDLRVEFERLRSLKARLQKGWSTAEKWQKTLVVGVASAAVIAVAFLLFVPAAPSLTAALVTGALSVITTATQVLRPINQGLRQAAKVLRADDADKRELERAQKDLAHAVEELTAARASGRAGLYGFVSERSSAAEYRQQLGMAPMIRDDLESLALLSRRAQGIDGIDRIVIFIDDLDRCPASEVVRVLEAVNLLFGFELFVVVVAVDSRWLTRSLVNRFSEAFDDPEGSAPTPQNYLEKIIQIPFWVQPMRPEGFGRLVTSLAGEVTQSPTSPPPGATDVSNGGQGAPPTTPAIPEGPSRGGPITGGGSGTPRTETPDVPFAGADTKTPNPSEENLLDDLNPEALRITSDERDCMKRFLPLVGTPRAAKRFLNTYQLLRVSVDDVDAFLTAKEYEPVLVLLALVTGTVHVTDAMIAELASMTQSNFGTFLTAVAKRDAAKEPPEHEWRAVKDACATLPTKALTRDLIKEWLPKVARYSFHHVEW